MLNKLKNRAEELEAVGQIKEANNIYGVMKKIAQGGMDEENKFRAAAFMQQAKQHMMQARSIIMQGAGLNLKDLDRASIQNILDQIDATIMNIDQKSEATFSGQTAALNVSEETRRKQEQPQGYANQQLPGYRQVMNDLQYPPPYDPYGGGYGGY